MSNAGRILVILVIVILTFSPLGVPLQARGEPKPQVKPSAVLGATEEILAEVGVLRGLEVLHPVKADLQSRAQIEHSLVEDMNEKMTPEEFEAEAKALTMLGLIPKDFKLRDFLIRLLTEQIAGYYRPKTKMLYLADWLALDEQRTVMVHELMHALQDQHFSLERFEEPPKGESDRDLAIHALIEGEATAVMVNYLLKPYKLDIARVPVPISALFEQMQETGDDRSELLRAAPPAIRETLLFPYTQGTQFVQHLLRETSWARVSDAYKNPPESTEQILHPERFVSRDEPKSVRLAPLEPVLGDGWKQRLSDVNGEFGYLVVLAEYIDGEAARRAAEGWDGDRLALYENNQTGTLLLTHLSTWDSVADAVEFTTAYAKRIRHRYAKVTEISGKRAVARIWKTAEGLAYLERRGSDVLVIETNGKLEQVRIKAVSKMLWNDQH
ncbi:MAG: hypothetical protein HY314_14155 [Acidobacteria bacterium]|nr:hypothetical protein [Acidobacteriota bacterium]